MVLYTNNRCMEQSHKLFKGVLELIPKRNNQVNLVAKNERVLVAVYKTTTNHFAVIYPQWGMDCSRKPICKINLLSTKVIKSLDYPDRQFSIVSTRECISFTFRILDKSKENLTIDDWISALSNTADDKTSFMKSSTKTVYKSKQIHLNLSVLDEEDVNEEND